MRILGLDLSLTETGVCGIDGSLCQTNRIRSKARGPQRLIEIRDAVSELLLDVDLVVIEGYSFNSKFSHAHALGELGGVVRVALHEHDVAWLDVSPAVLKKWATGKGNADKDTMLTAAVRAGFQGSNNNEADAWWLAHLGMHAYDRSRPVNQIREGLLDQLLQTVDATA